MDEYGEDNTINPNILMLQCEWEKIEVSEDKECDIDKLFEGGYTGDDEPKMSSLSSSDKIYFLHLNKDVNKPAFAWLELTEGVEYIQILSRYRLCVIIGKCFDDDIVKKNVEIVLQQTI